MSFKMTVGIVLIAIIAGPTGLSAKQLALAKTATMAKTRVMAKVLTAQSVPANEFVDALVFSDMAPPVGNTALDMEQSLMGSGWDTTAKTSYFKNSDGKIYQVVKKIPGMDPGSWENSTNTLVTYNTDKLITSATEQEWDPDSAKWLELVKYDFTYYQGAIKEFSASYSGIALLSGTFYYSTATAGRLDSMIMAISLFAVSQSKIVLTYNGSGEIAQTLSSDRDGTSGPWILSSRTTNVYPAAGTQVAVDEEWDTTADAWVRTDSVVSVKTADDKPVSETTWSWDATGGWIAYNKIAFTYSGTVSGEKLGQEWDDFTSAWTDSYKTLYSTEAMRIRQAAFKADEPFAITVLTPGKGPVQIMVSSLASTNISLNVYSINGRLVASPAKNQPLSGTGRFTLDTKGLSGLYACRVTTPRSSYTRVFSLTR